MDICIYQINNSRDEKDLKFMSLDMVRHKTGGIAIDCASYDKVYEGSVDCGNLEDVYEMFNLRHPFNFFGHSLSVSDVVEVKDTTGVPELVGRIRFYNSSTAFEECSYTDEARFKEDIDEARFVGRCIEVEDLKGQHVPYTEKGFYFCDSVGFEKIDFDPAKTQLFKGPETIQVLVVEPEKAPYLAEVGQDYRQMQRVVHGNIEATFPFAGDNVAVVCNEDGKNLGLPFNRSICDERGVAVDFMVGTFFITGVGEEDFCSLSEDQITRYSEMLREPGAPVRVGATFANLEDLIKAGEDLRKEPPPEVAGKNRDIDNCL